MGFHNRFLNRGHHPQTNAVGDDSGMIKMATENASIAVEKQGASVFIHAHMVHFAHLV